MSDLTGKRGVSESEAKAAGDVYRLRIAHLRHFVADMEEATGRGNRYYSSTLDLLEDDALTLREMSED